MKASVLLSVAPMLTHSLWSEVSVCTTLLHHITLQFIVLYYERSSFIVQQINQIQFLELLCNRKVIVGCNVEELKINHLMMFCCTLDVQQLIIQSLKSTETYSGVPNKHWGPNNRVGGKIYQKLINVYILLLGLNKGVQVEIVWYLLRKNQ